MRLGYLDENHTLDNAHAIEDAGANWLTVHARTKADGYTPPAYWEKIQPITEALKSMSLPMVKSGIIQMPKPV
jgi:tRNA-dihydrouridine synthase C